MTGEKGRAAAGKDRLLWPLYASTFLIRFSFSVMIMVFPLYLLHLDRVDYGLVWSASPAAELVTVILMGAVIDRYGRKPVLTGGLLLGTAMMFCMALTRNPFAIGVLNSFHGISAGMILASSLALLTDYAPSASRGAEMGTFDGANISGWGAGFLMGGLVNELLASDLYYGFVLAGALGAAGCIYVALSVREPAKEAFTIKHLSAGHILSVFRRRSVILLTIPWLMMYIMIGGALAFGGLEGKGAGIPAWLVGAGMAAICVLLMSTQRFFGRLSDRHGRMPLMLTGVSGILGLVATGGVVFLMGWPTLADITGRPLVWAPVLALAGVFGFMAFAFAPAALASLGDVAKRRQHGVTMSVYSMVISAGMVIGTPSSSVVLDAGGRPAMLGFFGLCAGLMLLFVVIRRFDLRRHPGDDNINDEEEPGTDN
jgi:MFS family permease